MINKPCNIQAHTHTYKTKMAKKTHTLLQKNKIQTVEKAADASLFYLRIIYLD